MSSRTVLAFDALDRLVAHDARGLRIWPAGSISAQTPPVLEQSLPRAPASGTGPFRRNSHWPKRPTAKTWFSFALRRSSSGMPSRPMQVTAGRSARGLGGRSQLGGEQGGSRGRNGCRDDPSSGPRRPDCAQGRPNLPARTDARAREADCTPGRSPDHPRPRPAQAVDLNWDLPLGDGVISIALEGDGTLLAVGDRTGTVTLVDTATRQDRGTIPPLNQDSDNNLLAMAFSPDGQNMAIGSPEGTISLWSVARPESPRLRFHLPGHRGIIFSLAFDSQNRRLASAGTDPLVEVWDLELLERELIRLGSGGLILDQRLEQQLELAQLDFAIERVVGPVDDGDGQRAVVAIPLEQVDDPGVFDLALADADLKFAGYQARIAQVDILDVGKNRVVIDVGVRALKEVAGVERQTQPGHELAQLHGDLGIGRQSIDMGEQGQHQALAHGEADERREPLDLVGDRCARAARRGS